MNEVCFRQRLPLKQRVEIIAAAASARLDAFSSSAKDDIKLLDEPQNGEMIIPETAADAIYGTYTNASLQPTSGLSSLSNNAKLALTYRITYKNLLMKIEEM